jgi:hypothetical protein
MVAAMPMIAEGRPARPAPPLPPPTGRVVPVSSEPGLQAAMRDLTSDTTILIAPGTYVLTRTLYIGGPLTNVAIRGASGNADDVILVGPGMANPNYGAVPFGIWTGLGVSGVTIANLTIRELFFHPIIFNGGTQRPRVYNVHLVNAGQQFIKSNPDEAGVGASDGILEYSVIEFTDRAKDDYTKGIDIQGAGNWIIRHNLFRNIVAPPGQIAGPGVLVWRGSRDTLVEGNTFVNCARGVMFGADDTVSPSHSGGIIRNNFFFRTSTQPGDVGIILSDSPNSQVVNNTLITSGTYRTPIEYRYPGTRGGVIANNLLDGDLGPRDGGTASLSHNLTTATPALFVNAAAGDLHLSSRATAAIDRGEATAVVTDDWDGEARPSGSAYDIGADEVGAAAGVAATATFVKVDGTTQGNWQGTYGRGGVTVIGDGDAYPASVQIQPSGHYFWTWDPSPSNSRALQRLAAGRIAATWYTGTQLAVDLIPGDTTPRQLSVYAVDWDNQRRSQQLAILDAATGAVLDSRLLSDFAGGQYLVWTVTGRVRIVLTRVSGVNAVISGLFLDTPGGTSGPGPSTSAVFAGADATTQGSWHGRYGRDGYTIVGDASSYPSGTPVQVSGQALWTWDAAPANARALERATSASRIAATWYTGDSLVIDVNFADAAAHRVALYLLDYDSFTRTERVDVLDAATGAVLDTQTVADFNGGRYLVWTVTGHVRLQVVRVIGINAVVSGLFLDPAQ